MAEVRPGRPGAEVTVDRLYLTLIAGQPALLSAEPDQADGVGSEHDPGPAIAGPALQAAAAAGDEQS